MTGTNGPALRVALAYHRAVADRDIDGAMAYVAEDIVCDAPAGRLVGAPAYRAFLAPFVQMLVRTDLIGAFGDERRAVLVYDSETRLVASGPAAECVTVEDGRITYSRFIFDRLPFEAARRSAA
jgi:ketosteroid isomerase-like protein